MANLKKEIDHSAALEVKTTSKNRSTKNTKIKSSIKLRDAEGKIRLMTKKGKRIAKTLEDWLKPSNYKLLTDNSQKTIKNGKTALQLLEEADS